MKESIKIEFLDHVAIRVKDVELSANWYEKVLGLKKYKLKEWGEFPIFLLSGKSGVALFPASRYESTPSNRGYIPNHTHLLYPIRELSFSYFFEFVCSKYFPYFRENYMGIFEAHTSGYNSNSTLLLNTAYRQGRSLQLKRKDKREKNANSDHRRRGSRIFCSYFRKAKSSYSRSKNF